MNIRDFFILVDRKAKISLKAEASRLYFSFMWWIIEPMLFVFAFYFVFNILLKYNQEDFLLFMLCAKIPYMWFSKAVTTAASSIVNDRGIISQIDINKAIFPYAAIQITLYKEIPVFALLVLLCVTYNYQPTINWLWLIPLFIVEYLFILVCGMAAALLVCYADDVRMLINMIMLFLMFISGIFFDISDIDSSMRNILLTFNPLAFLCDGFRKIFMNKGMYSLSHMLYLSTFLVSILIVIHVAYYRLSRDLAAKVVNL